MRTIRKIPGTGFANKEPSTLKLDIYIGNLAKMLSVPLERVPSAVTKLRKEIV